MQRACSHLTLIDWCAVFRPRKQVGSWSRVLEDAVRSLINDHGVTVVVASGNSGVDACYVAPGEAGLGIYGVQFMVFTRLLGRPAVFCRSSVGCHLWRSALPVAHAAIPTCPLLPLNEQQTCRR